MSSVCRGPTQDKQDTNHIQVDVNETLDQVLIRFNGRGMIAIFPVCPFAALPLVEFLPRPACDQLDRLWYYIPFAVIPDQEVYMVGRDREVENLEAITPPSLKKPLEVSAPISGEFQKEFPLVTTVGNMPDISGNVMSVCSGHTLFHLKAPFSGAKTSF